MKLAINGGRPIRTRCFPAYCTIGKAEEDATRRVVRSGVLSRYLGCWHENFMGGAEVRALEKEWAEYFGVKHAIAVNSCTSGLYAAVGAARVEPGDEVIVSPYTMSASATAPLIFGGVPVFADIEEQYFCLDPASVEARITPRTRAIIAVDIFGHPFDAAEILRIARKHKLLVIEDAAQAPGALLGRKYAGTLGDMGVYSLNYHKHIHCGEGGIVVTDNDDLADRVRLIRNHAEAVVGAKGTRDITNMVGFNFRMTELEAAVARCQLKKLKRLIDARLANCEYIASGLRGIPAIKGPVTRRGCRHVFYVSACKFDAVAAGVSRNLFIDAVRAELSPMRLRESEGVKISCGYARPLYLQPMFQRKIAYGRGGYPFRAPMYKGKVSYKKGICPVAERMHERDLFIHELMQPQLSRSDLDDVIDAFHKVWDNRHQIEVC